MALRKFIYAQRHPDYDSDFPLSLPEFTSQIHVFHSAEASFYAPSDLCGSRGMYQERIRANPTWRGNRRFDTVFVTVSDDEGTAMNGMLVARVLLFFYFMIQNFAKNSLARWSIGLCQYRKSLTM